MSRIGNVFPFADTALVSASFNHISCSADKEVN